MLRVSSLSYTYPGEDEPALRDVSFAAAPGECVCLTGHSGCGKSTLLLAIKGLLHGGTLAGDVAIDGPGAAAGEGVGIVFQNAESQLFCSTVAEEVAFGPENLCVAPDEIERRVRRALNQVQLEAFFDRNVERMSAGQKHRVAIASVLAMEPRVLLLDEPTSQLDAAGKAELAAVLAELKRQGYALLVVEHNLEPLRDLVDRYLVMEGGRIRQECAGIPQAYAGIRPRGAGPPRSVRPDEPAVSLRGVHLSYPGVGPVLRGVDLAVARGERVHLHARNGAGKSSLLACVAGAVRHDAGSIRVLGAEVSLRTRALGRVGYLFQNPQRQLFENTVHEEVAFSLKRLGLPSVQVHRMVAEALEACEAEHLAHRLPLALSFGEQHRVALASVLAPRPEVLLLDEPFSGLDVAQRHRLLDILARLSERHGTTLLVASHDPLPDPGFCDRVVALEGGALA